VELRSDSILEVRDQDGAAAVLQREPAWSVTLGSGELALGAPSGARGGAAGPLIFFPAPGALISVGGRAFRGSVVVQRDRTGLTVVNRVPMEEYLAGVVSAEMGKRDSSDREALAAQAVISRTYALRNLGKRRTEGFDLYPTVVDQVYGGVGAETPLGWGAVRETTGRILTYGGVPIDAFFFSTCGGQTADGTEVFAGANRPYLRSIRDQDADGQAYCRLSPRFQWHEEWTGDQLKDIFQRSLHPAPFREVRSVQVTSRTGSGRVSRIAVVLDQNQIAVEGPAVRTALHPLGDTMLRSAAFTLTETRQGQVLTGLVADGRGAGHGVGFCQWGAVGRSRAGQSFETILAAYFPGTSLDRLY
jgi:stage II sporulation protein D